MRKSGKKLLALSKKFTQTMRRLQRVAVESLEDRRMFVGTWTALSTTAPASVGTMLLLSDGTVAAQQAGVSANWFKLTPNSLGSYQSGTWSTRGSMSLQRLYFPSHVLPDGRMWIMGGEYSGPSGAANWINSAEMFNPVTNTWSSAASHPETQFGDVPTALLPDGRILIGSLSTAATYIYNPTTNTIVTGPTKLNNDRSDEETWVKMPDGSILSYNIFGNAQHAQRWYPGTNTWIDSGAVPVALQNGLSELGPALRIPDGRFVFLGGTNHNAIYTTAAGTGVGTWAALQDTPNNASAVAQGANDAPGAALPNGKILFAASQSGAFGSPTNIYELDPTAAVGSQITQVTGGPTLTGQPSYNTRMLMLPNGQVLFSFGSSQLWVYTPDGVTNDAWRPTVSGITNNGSNTFTLTGTQLNGQSEGASYGDDAEMSSNYPIVKLTSSAGVVSYAKSVNWSSTAVGTGSAPVTTQFTLPSGINPNVYRLSVSGAGIQSKDYLHIQMGTATTNTISLRVDPGNSANVQVITGGNVSLYSTPFATLAGIIVSGTSAADSITINGPFNGTPIYVDGGAGADTLNLVTSSSADNAVFNSGSIVLNGTNITTSTIEAVTFDGKLGSDTVTVNGGPAVTFPATQVFANLTVNAGATAQMAVNGGLVLDTVALTINATAKLDINDNLMIVRTTGALSSIQSKIQSGVGGLDSNGLRLWNGNGILSSRARSLNTVPGLLNDLYTIGAIRNGDLNDIFGAGTSYTTFKGRSVGAEDVLVRFTYAGDTNLDGTVTIDDYNAIDAAYLHLKSVRGWVTGDFDLNGSITIDDYNEIDTGWAYQTGALGV